MTVDYEKIVSILRDGIPELSLENVKFDIEKAVEDIGIDVRYSDMKGLDTDKTIAGYVHVVDGKPQIVVNGDEPVHRRRFTIAHELGHIFLHWGWLPGDELKEEYVEISYRNNTYNTKEERRREREADSFAAEFLAPLEEVKKSINRYIKRNITDKEDQIDEISEEYKVSNGTAYYLWRDAIKDL